MTTPTILPLFTEADAIAAFDAWGCNCGPSALASACGVTLETARDVLAGFDRKRYTNPSMMYAALRQLVNASLIQSFRATMLGSSIHREAWPTFGLARVQWEGPWTERGVPIAARYRQTHWVAVQKHPAKDEFAIFDVNAMHVGGVISADSWATSLVPWILTRCVPKASGQWHLTHAIEVVRPSEKSSQGGQR